MILKLMKFSILVSEMYHTKVGKKNKEIDFDMIY